MKKCTFCFIEKPLCDFYKKSKSRRHIGDGHENKCIKCTCLAQKDPIKRDRANELRRKRGNTEKAKEATKAWAKTKKGKSSAKRRRDKYLSNPTNKEKSLACQALYRKTSAFKKAIIKHRNKYPERRAAQIIISNAIQTGALIRPSYCSICDTKCIPEGHHTDYTKPLDVIWVCKKCHTDYHYSK